MKLDYHHLLPQDFHPLSRVWIYQSPRLLRMSEALMVEEELEKFCASWNSHGAKVRGFGTLLFGRFLLFIADESQVQVSGCSTDSSVHCVRTLGETLQTDFFDRFTLYFVRKENIEALPMAQMAYAIQNKFIEPDTLFFNNTVSTLDALRNHWIIPVSQSWLAAKFKLSQAGQNA